MMVQKMLKEGKKFNRMPSSNEWGNVSPGKGILHGMSLNTMENDELFNATFSKSEDGSFNKGSPSEEASRSDTLIM